MDESLRNTLKEAFSNFSTASGTLNVVPSAIAKDLYPYIRRGLDVEMASVVSNARIAELKDAATHLNVDQEDTDQMQFDAEKLNKARAAYMRKMAEATALPWSIPDPPKVELSRALIRYTNIEDLIIAAVRAMARYSARTGKTISGIHVVCKRPWDLLDTACFSFEFVTTDGVWGSVTARLGMSVEDLAAQAGHPLLKGIKLYG